jgi:hypothetical protein
LLLITTATAIWREWDDTVYCTYDNELIMESTTVNDKEECLQFCGASADILYDNITYTFGDFLCCDYETFSDESVGCILFIGGETGGEPVCIDDDSTTDTGNDDCSWYDEERFCGGYDDDDFSSNDQCCICGGGVTPDACKDNESVSDAEGNTCFSYSFYNKNPESCGIYDTEDFIAADECCGCGGGIPLASNDEFYSSMVFGFGDHQGAGNLALAMGSLVAMTSFI